MRVWQEETSPKRAKPRWGLIPAAVAILFVITVCVIYMVLHLQSYVVTGRSMEPTLREGDTVRFNTSREPGYGDIVVFYSEYDLLVKRVIALPGDVVSVSPEGRVTRNGQLLDEPYIVEDTLGNSAARELVVEDGHLFVMGDNRGVSVDSRDMRIGQIKDSAVCGCVVSFTRALQNEVRESEPG